MSESRKKQALYSQFPHGVLSVSIPCLLFPTQSDYFCFFTGKQIKATMITVA